MADFELLKVHDVGQLHENLERMLSNKKHIDNIIVDLNNDEIRVDLSKVANAFGNQDFRLKLASGKGAEAKTLLARLQQQDHATRMQAQELYDMLVQ